MEIGQNSFLLIGIDGDWPIMISIQNGVYGISIHVYIYIYHQQYELDIWICLKIYPHGCLNMGNYEIMKQIALQKLTSLAFALISDHPTRVQQITDGLRDFASMDIVTCLEFS